MPSDSELIQQANDHLVEHGGDVAMALLDALGQLAITEQRLRDLVEANERFFGRHGFIVPNLPSGFKKQFTDALTAARELLEAK